MTSKVLVNNFRGLHLNSPDDVVVNNSTGTIGEYSSAAGGAIALGGIFTIVADLM